MEIPDFDNLTPNQVREWGKEVARRASQLGEIKATLIVNCKPNRCLGRMGLQYDDTKPVIHNLVHILEKLAFGDTDLHRERDDLARALFRIRSLTMRGRGDSAVAKIACEAVRSIDETPLVEIKDSRGSD